MVTTMDLLHLIAANPGGEHQRSKHIDVRYHYVRQQIEEKFIAALKIGTKYQLADFTTKAIAVTQFMFLALIAIIGNQFWRRTRSLEQVLGDLRRCVRDSDERLVARSTTLFVSAGLFSVLTGHRHR